MIGDLDEQGRGPAPDRSKAAHPRRRRGPRRTRTVALAAALVAVSVSSVPASALEVAGVAFAPSRQAEGTALELSGAGLSRYRMVIKAYAAALYTEPGLPAERVLKAARKALAERV